MGAISEIIGIPLGLIIWLIYKICDNYAISIVIFTIITKLLLVPLSIKQQKSTAAMTALQPKLEKLKKKYGNNQEKYSEETMKLYNEEGVNPMASCLPMFIQFPILYGILDVVYRPIYHMLRIGKDTINLIAAKVAENPDFTSLIYQNIEKKDKLNYRAEMYIIEAVQKGVCPAVQSEFPEEYAKIMEFDNTLFGANLSNTPTLKPEVWNSEAWILVLIPILSGVFQMIYSIYSVSRQKKTNPEASAAMGSMNMMFFIMPIFSVWMAFTFPAAMGFYWMISSVFSLFQQLILNKIFTPEYVAKLVEKDKIKKKNSKKRGLMERYQQLYEEQMAAQNGGRVSSSNNDTSRARAALAGIIDEDEDDGSKEIKLSKSKQKEYERMLIREARRRQAEKYGDEFIDDDED